MKEMPGRKRRRGTSPMVRRRGKRTAKISNYVNQIIRRFEK